jgi:hypothetical protein
MSNNANTARLARYTESLNQALSLYAGQLRVELPKGLTPSQDRAILRAYLADEAALLANVARWTEKVRRARAAA